MIENVSKVCHLPRFELSHDRSSRPTDPAPPPSDRPTLTEHVDERNALPMALAGDIDQKALLRELQAMYFDKN